MELHQPPPLKYYVQVQYLFVCSFFYRLSRLFDRLGYSSLMRRRRCPTCISNNLQSLHVAFSIYLWTSKPTESLQKCRELRRMPLQNCRSSLPLAALRPLGVGFILSVMLWIGWRQAWYNKSGTMGCIELLLTLHILLHSIVKISSITCIINAYIISANRAANVY